MEAFSNVPPSTTDKWMARLRRFFHWFTKPQVLLSLVMLLLMFVMVVIPLYRLVETTVTYQAHDLTRVPTAIEGKLTSYHWVRMLTGIIGRIYTYAPLKNSITIAVGSTLLALLIGGSLAWLVIRTDMPRTKPDQSACRSALHHAFLDFSPSLACTFQEQNHRRHARCL
jgi:ABC-type spermidine/putrescine transport system permease subunit I